LIWYIRKYLITTPLAARIKVSMNRNLKVGMEDISWSSVLLNCFSNAESGIDRRVMIMKTMMVIAPQKKAMTTASFLLIS
jgi:hypothetical protein